MSAVSPYVKALVERVVALRLQGRKIYDVAVEMKLSEGRILQLSSLAEGVCFLGKSSDLWPPEKISRLSEMWADGVTVSQIAAALKISKNSVVGKVHRLRLPNRPSPITRQGYAAPSRKHIKRAPAITLAPRAVERVESPTRPAVEAAQCDVVEIKRPIERHFVPPCPPVERRTPVPRAAIDCCWPIGQPGKVGFRFCDAPAQGRRPYCASHCAVAYARPGDRQERRAQ